VEARGEEDKSGAWKDNQHRRKQHVRRRMKGARVTRSPYRVDFFSILTFFNYFLRNEPGGNFFSNMTFLSHASPVGVTYERVTPCTLVQLGSTPSHSLPRGLNHAA
jgi:hypothetical protein